MSSHRRRLLPCTSGVFFALVILLVPTLSWALPILIPTGLSPSETYHLVFVSSVSRNGSSSVLAEYDAFVQAAADAAGIGSGSAIGNITWKAIGSTAGENAVDHIAIAGGVYRLDDVLVATSSGDFFDATIAAPINVNENVIGGVSTIVWTGTQTDGTAHPFLQLGSTGNALLGLSSSVVGNALTHDNQPSAQPHPFYAISTALEAPPIPEPSPLLLVACGLAAMAWTRKHGEQTGTS